MIGMCLHVSGRKTRFLATWLKCQFRGYSKITIFQLTFIRGHHIYFYLINTCMGNVCTNRLARFGEMTLQDNVTERRTEVRTHRQRENSIPSKQSLHVKSFLEPHRAGFEACGIKYIYA